MGNVTKIACGLSGSEWVEDLSEFNEDFIKRYDEKSNEGYFLEADVNILRICIKFTMIYRFCLKYRKFIKTKNCS